MRRSFLTGTLIATIAVSLASCAMPKPPKLAVCDGKAKHRRNANPYGSVLPGAPAAAPAGDGQAPISPPPPPPKTSAIGASTFFASC